MPLLASLQTGLTFLTCMELELRNRSVGSRSLPGLEVVESILLDDRVVDGRASLTRFKTRRAPGHWQGACASESLDSSGLHDDADTVFESATDIRGFRVCHRSGSFVLRAA